MQLTPGAEGRILGGRIGAVGHLVINNPERRNAIDLDMWRHAASVLDELAADDETRLLVVSGAGGKAFASGADISRFETERSTAEEVRRYAEISASVYERLESFPRPTIAKIAGYCVGGGLALAVCCDLRICEAGSRFALPAARLGIGYGHAAQKRLANVVGTAYAAEILFTARQFTAAEAYEMGLVNRVVERDDLDAFVDDYAARIADNAPLTVALAKAGKIALNAGADAAAIEALNAMVDTCYASQDYAEGRRAFMEKRKPRFTGK
ncbi:MAG: enoyl-CoA hydratase/isomerase family protein [Rhodobiaceae bacterium]|nr:enoyl-CoA hydratase/isomerase family protein [Rhodobiaceae bacterium]MCC0014769.1 enoyl-CoA hydratase/isomerase family protein [Rhodobiaceae bacterium]MCC0041377.1 enoyl-CoA hydratase/isomerase family protein [Rhodobiaceae bacterium]MCC0054274.1 enoyl-CoA hydratase/isomerase family protein [Rhodobiaceae bacterium]